MHTRNTAKAQLCLGLTVGCLGWVVPRLCCVVIGDSQITVAKASKSVPARSVHTRGVHGGLARHGGLSAPRAGRRAAAAACTGLIYT